MKSKIWTPTLIVVLLYALVPSSLGKEKAAFKEQERLIVSLELQFTRKNQRSLQRAISFLLDSGPNGFATGFLVGDGLIMTSYHVVSGELSDSKKVILGFARHDQLEVKVSVHGQQAKLIQVDKDADLALLAIDGDRRQTRMPAFDTTPVNSEKLYLIARPHGDRIVRHGVFHGSYSLRGLQYLSVKIESRDGYSGSPVYNQNAEVVGVFSGYDWSQKVALISPGERAQKLVESYLANPRPTK